MANVSALLDTKTFARLGRQEIEKLSAIIDSTILDDPEIRRKLEEKMKEAVPELKSSRASRK